MSKGPPDWFHQALTQVHAAGLLFAGKTLDEYRLLDAWDMWKQRARGATAEQAVAAMLALDQGARFSSVQLRPAEAADLLHELSYLRRDGVAAFSLALGDFKDGHLRVKIAGVRSWAAWPQGEATLGLGQLLALCTHLLGRSIFQSVPVPGGTKARGAVVLFLPDAERGRLESIGLRPAAPEPLSLKVTLEDPAAAPPAQK